MDAMSNYNPAAMKQNRRNIIMMSISFSFIYFGINTYKNFAVPLLGNLGSICLGTLYTMAAIANILVPAVLYVWEDERKPLIFSCFVMVIYILQYAYIIPALAFIMCFLTGIFFAISWSTESILIAKNSVDENRAFNSNLFYGIFMIGNVFGNGFAYILLNIVKVATNVVHDTKDVANRGSGWNGGISFLFIGLSVSSLIGSFLMFFVKKNLPTSLPMEVEVVATEPQDETLKSVAVKNEVKEPVKSTSLSIIWQKAVAVLTCIAQPKMLLLLLLFINNGYGQILVASQVNRQVEKVELVGLSMVVFALAEVIVTVILAFIADKAGHRITIGVGVVAELIGLVLTFYMDKYQGWLVFVTPILFAVMDTVYQTECVAVVGRYFTNNLQDSFATYRLVQGLGSSISSFVTPLFVSKGSMTCEPDQLIVELAVAAILAVVSYISFIIFLHYYGIKTMPTIEKDKKVEIA